MDKHPLTRREFTRRALATSAIVGTVTETSTATAGEQPVEARRPLAADRDAAGERSAIEDSLLEVIRRRYSDPRLRPAILREIRHDLTGDVERSRILNSFALHNSDEPGFVFAAYRGDAIR